MPASGARRPRTFGLNLRGRAPRTKKSPPHGFGRAVARGGGEPDSDEKRGSIETISDPCWHARELKPLDPGRQHVNRENCAGDVEPAMMELRRSEEGRREGRQHEGGSDGRIRI